MMIETKHLPVSGNFVAGSAYVTLGEISTLCNLDPRMIVGFVRLGLINPVGKNEPEEAWTFPVDTVPLVRKIIRLRNGLGINYSGIGVVLSLLSRIETLEARVHELENPRS